MSLEKKTVYILVDTSFLRSVSFGDPDFRKLLEYSKNQVVKIFVPHIAWEERRTQFLEKACEKVGKVTAAFTRLEAEIADNFILNGMQPPELNIWNDSDINARSIAVMHSFATENDIQIVPLSPDHAHRAWKRYFDIAPPFNATQERESRRKDIPDSWILETAIDLVREFPELYALCRDEKLSNALKSIEVSVFATVQDVIDLIEKALPTSTTSGRIKFRDQAIAATVAVTDEGDKMAATVVVADDGEKMLEDLLSEARDSFKELDTKVLGYVAYLGQVPKEELFGLLSKVGISDDVAKNIAERLSLANLIHDTGHYYLVRNKRAGDLAIPSVENEIISLLQG